MDVAMLAAPIPPPFECVEGRKFAFYPPIAHAGSNEWRFRKATWSELVVRNVGTGKDVSIPRRFVGEASESELQDLVITLAEPLEYRDGFVRPQRSRVIEMTLQMGEASAPLRESRGPAAVVGIRLESRYESRASRIAGGAVALGVLGCLALVGYSLHGGEAHRRAIFTNFDSTYLALSGTDNYRAVVRTLGIPEKDQYVTTGDGTRLRVLDYVDRGFRAVLLSEGADDRYLGAVDLRGQVLQAVLLPQGRTSTDLLRGLKDF